MKYYDAKFVLDFIMYLTRLPVNMRILSEIVKVLQHEVDLQIKEQDEEKSEKEAEESMKRLNEKFRNQAIENGIKEGIEKWKKDNKKK